MNRDAPLQIGIHAPPRAGKTCLFACLYGLRLQFQPETVSFDDPATLDYLKRIWRCLVAGRPPDPTAMAPLTHLRFQIDTGGKVWSIQTSDYPGALVVPSTDGTTKELRAEARDWFHSCDAILILLDSQAPDIEQLDVVDCLLAELRKESLDGRTIARPLGLVLTKWDTQGPISRDQEEEIERRQKYLVDCPIFERICRNLRECGERFSVFTISAFGKPCPAPGRVPHIGEMIPYHLLEPWIWAAQLSNKLRQERQKLRRRRRWRRSIITALLLSAGITALALTGTHNSKQEFAQLDQFRQDHPETTQAEARQQADERYLASAWSWFAPNQREQAKEWHNADARTWDQYQEEIAYAARHDPAFQRISLEGPKLEEKRDYGGAYETYHRFLVEFPTSARRTEVRQRMQDARMNWDQIAWKDVVQFDERSRGVAFETTIRKTKEYLAIPEALHKEEAKRLLARTEYEWDRNDYLQILKEQQKGRDGATLDAVAKLIQDYFHAPRTHKRMTPELRRWQAWFDMLHEERQYHIHVKSVSIPAGSQLDSIFGMNPRVSIMLGDISYTTAKYSGRAPVMEVDLAPYVFRWGKQTFMRVKVENRINAILNDETTIEFTDPRFVLQHAHGRVDVIDKKGKTITVELDCPGAVPPPLPPYPAVLE